MVYLTGRGVEPQQPAAARNILLELPHLLSGPPDPEWHDRQRVTRQLALDHLLVCDDIEGDAVALERGADDAEVEGHGPDGGRMRRGGGRILEHGDIDLLRHCTSCEAEDPEQNDESRHGRLLLGTQWSLPKLGGMW